MMARVRKRLHEQKTGDYDFQHMHRQARATPPLIDCATYAAPVEIRQSPGRGRGLFTTRRISAGELLLCEKAFGYVFAEDGSAASNTILMNMNTKRVTMGGHANLITQLVQKLYHDLEAAQSFAKLHHGDYKAALATEVDGRPIVDTYVSIYPKRNPLRDSLYFYLAKHIDPQYPGSLLRISWPSTALAAVAVPSRRKKPSKRTDYVHTSPPVSGYSPRTSTTPVLATASAPSSVICRSFVRQRIWRQTPSCFSGTRARRPRNRTRRHKRS